MKERYRQRSTFAGYKPQPVTLVLEEQTNWAGKVDGADTFLKQTLSDIRKVGYQSISVAHGSTNAARGGAVGTARMREQGEFKIELIEQGLAQISIKGRESFMLRYPDPKPYTVNCGEPIVAKDGSINQGAAVAQQQTLDVGVTGGVNAETHAQQATAQFTPPVTPTPTPANIWELFRKHYAKYPDFVAVSLWLEKRAGEDITLRQLRDNKTLRSLLQECDRTKEQCIGVFVRHGLVEELVDGSYHVPR